MAEKKEGKKKKKKNKSWATRDEPLTRLFIIINYAE